MPKRGLSINAIVKAIACTEAVENSHSDESMAEFLCSQIKQIFTNYDFFPSYSM